MSTASGTHLEFLQELAWLVDGAHVIAASIFIDDFITRWSARVAERNLQPSFKTSAERMAEGIVIVFSNGTHRVAVTPEYVKTLDASDAVDILWNMVTANS